MGVFEGIFGRLRDRWQAAKDMTGKPIPGPQWVMIDLGRRAQLTRLVLDWETAYGKAYTVELSEDGKGKPPRYRCHLGCILLKMPAISLLTG